MRARYEFGLTLAVLATAIGVAAAEDRYADNRFEIGWRATNAAGVTRFECEIINRQPVAVQEIVLAVESLDATGRVVAASVAYLHGAVPGLSSRAFTFRTRLAPDAKGARLRAVSWKVEEGF